MNFDCDLTCVLEGLPQADLPMGGPFPNCNAYVCVVNGEVQIYFKDGGWLGIPITTSIRADVAPWSD